jgi:maleamate amidohydrolase
MEDQSELKKNYASVFDYSVGFGQRPALIVVDFLRAYTTKESPLYAPEVLKAVAQTNLLIREMRKIPFPIIFTRVLYHPSFLDGGLFVVKIPCLKNMVEGNPLAQFEPTLEVSSDDLVISKQYASVFFGTSLSSTLTALRIDTVILAGCSTSGCIRASAVDGMQYGLRVIVPRECVADRDPKPHEANLFDINAKYGDVLSLGEVIERVQMCSHLTKIQKDNHG